MSESTPIPDQTVDPAIAGIREPISGGEATGADSEASADSARADPSASDAEAVDAHEAARPVAGSNLGARPISEQEPAGRLATDDDRYEALKAEATKDALRGEIDWARVVELGEEVLTELSKDFVVLAYYTVGKIRTAGLQGLADSLSSWVEMVERYWDTGFPSLPKRLRGRANAVAWMSEHAGRAVEQLESSAEDRETVASSLESLDRLDGLLRERLSEEELQLGDLLRALRTARERLPAEAAPPAHLSAVGPEADAQGDQGPQAPVSAPSSSLGPTEIRSKADANQWITKCASFLRANDATSPIAYRLTRIVRWSPFATAPPDQAGKTQLLPPPAERISGLRGLATQGDWQGLLENAEAAFWERPLWLDAQRYSVTALSALGGPYQLVHGAILLELSSLLARAPNLAGLSFKDGTPLADTETRSWIDDEVRGGENSSPGTTPVEISAIIDPEQLRETREEAKKLARKNQIPEAIASLQALLDADASPRGRFLARLEVAQLLAESGKEKLALPLLEELDGSIRAHGLECWEPALSIRVLRSLYRCRRIAADREPTPESSERADEVFARICRIDPIQASGME